MNFNWKYKYLTLLLASIVLAAFLGSNQDFNNFLLNLGGWEYFGAFFAGMLFVSSFTVAASAVIIAILAQDLHPLTIAIIGGWGALLGDLIIFRFVKDHLADELALLVGKAGRAYIKSVVRSKYIGWTLPIIGVFIIASPLPDELGISLLGTTEISRTRFIVVSFLSNAFGIMAIASVARVF